MFSRRLVFAIGCFAVAGTLALACGGPRGSREELTRLRNVAKAHFENGQTDEAIEIFQSCIRLADDPIDHLSLAKAYFLAERYDEAIAKFGEVRRKAPEYPDVPYCLGMIMKRLGRMEESIAELERFVRVDSTSTPAWYNLGLVYARAGRDAEARRCIERVLRLDPVHAPAHYQMYVLARTAGDMPRAEAEIAVFERLREHIPSERMTPESLEESPYFEIGVRRPGEAPRPEPAGAQAAPTEVRFVDVTPRAGLTRAAAPEAAARRVVPFDYDRDGDLDVFAVLVPEAPTADRGSIALFRNGGALRFDEVPVGPSIADDAVDGAVGDYDNDGDLDLYVVTGRAGVLYRNESGAGDGRFTDVTSPAWLGDAGGGAEADFLDYDHDGDLDLLVTTPIETEAAEGASIGAARSLLYRNNGAPTPSSPCTFTEVTEEAALPGRTGVSAAVGDFDRDGAIDLAAVDAEAGVRILRNAGRMRFEVEDPLAGGSSTASAGGLAAGDLDGDGWIDLVVAGGSGCIAYTNRGECRFRPESTLSSASSGAGARWPLLLDLDGDGDLDLLAVAASGTQRPFVNDGGGAFRDAGADLAVDRVEGALGPASAGDLDGDGDLDLLVPAAGGIRLLRNDGGDRHRLVRVQLRGKKSNRSGIGAEVELRQGDFVVTRTVDREPIEIGIGDRDHLDYARVAWPSRIVQNLVGVDLQVVARVEITEKDVALGSCPALFAWDGDRYALVTDVLGTTALGMPFSGGGTMPYDDEELIQVPAELLKPLAGEFRFQLTGELNEIVYLDHAKLVAVDHPPSVGVYSNTILGAPPFPEPDVVAVSNERPPVSAVDAGGVDRLADVSRTDGVYAGIPREAYASQLYGFAEEQALALDLGTIDPHRTVLIVSGWIGWPETPQFVSADQNPDLALLIPTLEVERDGRWQELAAFGIQALKPKTVVIDLGGRLRDGERVVRLRTNVRAHFDRIAVADRARAPDLVEHEVAPLRADLHFRGHSASIRPDGTAGAEGARHRNAPGLYDYDRVSLKAPWVLPHGRFTRYGDVLPLVTDRDDMFVVLNSGDEVSMAFPAAGLPASPAGWRRDFFVYLGGYTKESDYASFTSGVVDPLPFEAMSTYPYAASERYPDGPAHRSYLATYNTRVVRAQALR